MSLADELLADLEDGPDEEQENMKDTIPETEEEMPKVEVDTSMSVKCVAKLRDSMQLQNILHDIEYFSQHVENRKIVEPVEADPEYTCIIDANNITMEIDNEINVIHKYVRDIYNKRFPELESLVPEPLDYLRTVKELGNNINSAKNNATLQDFLTPANIMVVCVLASTTQLPDLDKEDLDRVVEACNMALELLEHKGSILEYIESRMSLIAPNLSNIIGTTTAAKIMGIAGGLTSLSKMPACNVLLLGAQKRTQSGFSFASNPLHTGAIYFSKIVQKMPHDLRKKAARLVAAKCTLAARVDSFHKSKDGKTENSLLADIVSKLDKLLEPPPVKQIKPLPAPIDPQRKKRGGRRYRKMKERLGMTEMRRAANRMNFGDIGDDAYSDDLGLSLGNLGKSGRVRGPQMDSKTKVKISKTLQQTIQKQHVWGTSTTVKKQLSGTASSVVFTPLQGLEIVNPHKAQKGEESNQKYFSATSGFMSVKK